jgi:hypothetical protein
LYRVSAACAAALAVDIALSALSIADSDTGACAGG